MAGVELLTEKQKVRRTFDSGVQLTRPITAARGPHHEALRQRRTQPYAGGGLGVTRVQSIRKSPSGCALGNNIFTCSGSDVFRATPRQVAQRIRRGAHRGRQVLFVRPELRSRGQANACASEARSQSARRGSEQCSSFPKCRPRACGEPPLHVNLEGIFPPIPTPVSDESVDDRGLPGNVARWMQTRLAGLV